MGSSWQDGSCDTHNHTILPKGFALWTPARFGAALLTRQSERHKGMNIKNADAGLLSARQWITLRVSQEEKKRAEEQATNAGLSVSEYMRRRVFGGRPVVALTDEAMLRELRRVGGLLKHNFETVRQAGMEVGHAHNILAQMEDALRQLVCIIERIGAAYRALR